MDFGIVEGIWCMDLFVGKFVMVFKCKGGLKLNVICVKLSCQVVVEK